MGEKMVSVCMITYNHESYIRHALESVLGQVTEYDYEILVGDDCSVDNTVDVIKNVIKEHPDAPIKLYAREKNLGLGSNMYDLKCKAKGKYVATLEGDDFWIDKKKLQRQVKFLEDHPDCEAVASRVIYVNEREHPTGGVIPEIEKLDRIFGKEDAVKYQSRMVHPASLMTKNIFRDSDGKYSFLGMPRKNFGNHLMSVFLLCSMGGIYIEDKITAAYRAVSRATAHNANSMVRRNPVFWKCGRVDATLYIKENLRDEYDFSPIIANEYVSLLGYMHTHNVKERKKIALSYFKKFTLREKTLVFWELIKN